MCVVQVFRPLLYIYVNNISTTAKKISYTLRTITIILNFGQIQCPLQDIFSACVVQFMRDETKWSQQNSSMNLLGQHIHSNLGYAVYSSYTTTLLNRKQITGRLTCAHLELVAVWYMGCIRSCSAQTSSIYPHGWYINSNLGHVICSKCTTTILVHEWVQFPRQIRFFAYIV